MIVNGANGSSVSASGGVSGSNYVVTHTSNLASVIITFGVSTIPPSGNYSIVTSAPTASQCKFALGSGGNAASGVVSVTAGTPNTATYSNIIVGTITLTGVAKY